MDDRLTYQDMVEMFENQIIPYKNYYLQRTKEGPAYRRTVEVSWLDGFVESELDDGERLNVLLPLLKWFVKHDLMSDFLEHDLRVYYEMYSDGELESMLADYEADAVISALIWCYKTYFLK